MFLPKPLYEALPGAYIAVGGICLYLVFGLTVAPGLINLKSILLFAGGCILGSLGVVVLSLRLQYRRNRTVFVKQTRLDTVEHHPLPDGPHSL